MNTRFEARLNGFGWPAVWDKTGGCFLPGHYPTFAEAIERATMLNDGRAPVATSAPPASTTSTRKSKAVDDEPTLF